MKAPLKHVLREAAAIAGDAARVAIGAPFLPIALPAAVAGIALFGTATIGASLATETGRAILAELRRRVRLREPRPEAPSLRGIPTPAELSADWETRPRTLAIRLRLGSRLADLSPTLDSSNRYSPTSSGSRRIATRGPGFKGWLADRRVQADYSTLMRYKRLAVRLRALLELDARLPLECILPGESAVQRLPAALRPHYASARRRLSRLLRDHRNFSRLSKHVETALGLTRLPGARRIRAVGLDDIQAEAARREFIDFLHAPGLPPRLERLRQDAVSGFL